VDPRVLLLGFVGLRLLQQAAETGLAILNRRYAREPQRLRAAAAALALGDDELAKAVAYSSDRFRFGLLATWCEVAAVLAVVASGALGLVERWAHASASAVGFATGAVPVGLAFFAILSLASGLLSLPFDLWATFRIEERHGFNRQTLGGFFLDRLKGVAVALVLGTPLLTALLWVMERMGPSWWLAAWAIVVAFNLLAVYIYPTWLAPLFNRFTPLAEGELRDAIVALAERVGFRAGGIFVMDASRRTAHGNAYFTGLFRQKRIVLFDTLIASLGARETLAVLAHELGHFKLHHVRWALVRSVAASGLLLFVLSRLLPLQVFYSAFALERSSYGALVVFGLWFALAAFLLQPLENALSRRHEHAADAFALRSGASAEELGAALKKLREQSKLLPLSHPLYSRVYHSHPPLLERLRALGVL
jgi:STE24 endopeptidase